MYPICEEKRSRIGSGKSGMQPLHPQSFEDVLA